jgi:hypothetical protein
MTNYCWAKKMPIKKISVDKVLVGTWTNDKALFSKSALADDTGANLPKSKARNKFGYNESEFMHDFEQCHLRAAADFFSFRNAFKNIFWCK